MIVLGFDTATPATVVGLRLSNGTTLQTHDEPTGDERPGHTTRLLSQAGELLARAELSWRALERIAVGVGPGTFTGLRIGLATARGLAQSLGVDVVGVSTLRVLAEAALQEAQASGSPVGEGPGWAGQLPAALGLKTSTGAADLSVSRDLGGSRARLRPDDAPRPGQGVLAVIDARRGEAFAAAYSAESPPASQGSPVGEPARPGGLARELVAARALSPQELGGIPAQAGGGHDWLAVGDGALRFRGYLEAIAVAVPADASPLHRVDPGVLCELASSAPAGDLEAVLPDYRRRPDAEIALEEAEN